MDNGDDETPAGKVVGVFMRQYLGKDKQLLLAGTIKGKQLFVTVDGSKALPPAAWNEAAIGLYRQHRIFQERRAKPGDRFRYASFELSINRLINTQVEVKDHEDVELLGGAGSACCAWKSVLTNSATSRTTPSRCPRRRCGSMRS